MKIQEKFCYKGFVPENFEKKDVVIGTKVPESLKRQLDEIAEFHDRTVSYVFRELMIRELSLRDPYHQADAAALMMNDEFFNKLLTKRGRAIPAFGACAGKDPRHVSM